MEFAFLLVNAINYVVPEGDKSTIYLFLLSKGQLSKKDPKFSSLFNAL